MPIRFNKGLRSAVRTMRVGEKARVRIQSEAAYGEEGNEALGVPPQAELEIEIELHQIIKVDVYAEGGILKRRLEESAEYNYASRGALAGTPQVNAEVVVRWSGVLVEEDEDDCEEFRPLGEERLVVGDDVAQPPFWTKVLSSFHTGETSELNIEADDAWGDDGSMEYDVPPGCPVRLTATLLSFVPVTDLSAAQDRSALKRMHSDPNAFGISSPQPRCAAAARALLPPPSPPPAASHALL